MKKFFLIVLFALTTAMPAMADRNITLKIGQGIYGGRIVFGGYTKDSCLVNINYAFSIEPRLNVVIDVNSTLTFVHKPIFFGEKIRYDITCLTPKLEIKETEVKK